MSLHVDGVEKSVRMLQRRGCLAVRSRSWRRQPEKLGCQQMYDGTTRRLVAEEERRTSADRPHQQWR